MITLGTAQATSSASPEAFFERWADHETWPEWDTDTEWAKVEGEARLGAKGILKPKSGPRVKFTISAFTPGHEYTDTSKLPGATLVFQHLAVLTEKGTELSAVVTLSGPLAPLWAKIMGGDFKTSVPEGLEKLVEHVEAAHARH